MSALKRQNEVKPRKCSIFEDRYERMYTLGKGNFGKVYLARNRETGKEVAIKVVDKRLFKNGDQKQHAQREQAICEGFATNLRHKNIVEIYDVVADESCIYVVMEFIEGGELFDKIKKDTKLAEPLARRWFREIVEAVKYIHENGIVHRDLKPENVLIDKSQTIRICDFGFGKKVREQQEVLSTYCGSPFYAAPEMVTATPYKGPPVDMWSCGVILYAMLTGTLPFQGDDMPELFQKISKCSYSPPRDVSEEACALISRLLCKDAKKRITAEACLLDPWLASPLVRGMAASTSSRTALSDANKSMAVTPTDSTHQTIDSTETNSPSSPAQTSPKSKKSKMSRFFLMFVHKKAQVAPTSKAEKITIRSVENKVVDRFKGLFKSAFRRRIT